MMNKKRTKQIERTKYLIFLPLAALLLIVSNIEAIARSTERLIDQVIQPEENIQMAEVNTVTEQSAPIPAPAPKQEKMFLYKGTVIDTNNKPLKGVQIVVENTTTPLTVTNEKGEFSFEWKNKVGFSLLYRTNENVVIVQSVTSHSEKKDRQNMVIVMAKVPAFLPEEVTTPDQDTVFEIVEQMPEFPGGQKALMEFIATNLKYPKAAHENKTQGRVMAQFIVDKEGNVIKPSIVRSVSPELDEEAIRVISTMPKWKPGKQRGKEVAVKYTIPLMFRLTTDNQKPTQELIEQGKTQIDGETVYSLAESMPEFVGGGKALMEYITKELQYPAEAKEKGIQGRVVIQFVVDKEGNIKHPQIVRNIDPLLDKEAVRLISNMPKWQPGKVKGENVSVKYTLPVMFRLPQ